MDTDIALDRYLLAGDADPALPWYSLLLDGFNNCCRDRGDIYLEIFKNNLFSAAGAGQRPAAGKLN